MPPTTESATPSEAAIAIRLVIPVAENPALLLVKNMAYPKMKTSRLIPVIVRIQYLCGNSKEEERASLVRYAKMTRPSIREAASIVVLENRITICHQIYGNCMPSV